MRCFVSAISFLRNHPSKMKVLGHSCDEGIDFLTVEVEKGNSVAIVTGRGDKGDSFVLDVLADSLKLFLGTGANGCCVHVYIVLIGYMNNIDTSRKKFNKLGNFFFANEISTQF